MVIWPLGLINSNIIFNGLSKSIARPRELMTTKPTSRSNAKNERIYHTLYRRKILDFSGGALLRPITWNINIAEETDL